MQTIILLVIVVGALTLFATEKLRADLIAIIVTATLALTGLITVEQAFAGFSSPAVITVAAVFVLSTGLIRTGSAEHLTRALRTLGGSGERRVILATVLLVGTLSSFMNNIGAAILLMPAVMAVAKDAHITPGRLLIPLAFGSLLGGLTTLIGTPPNLLISLTLAEYGYKPFQVFDFTPVGLLVLLTGTLFLVVCGPLLLPEREDTSVSRAGLAPKNEEVSSEVLLQPPPPTKERADQIVAQFGLRVLAVLKERHKAYREMAASHSNGYDVAEGKPRPATSPSTDHDADAPATDTDRDGVALATDHDAVAPATQQDVDVEAPRHDTHTVATRHDAAPIPETDEHAPPSPKADDDSTPLFKTEKVKADENAVLPSKSNTDIASPPKANKFGARGNANQSHPSAATATRPVFDDTLIVAGARDNLLRAVAARKVRLLAELKHPPDTDAPKGDIRLAEATLAPRSTLSGKTLSELDFYNRYGLTVIGIRRHGESIREPLSELRLRFGDTLLLRGSYEHIRRLSPDSDFLLLTPVENSAPNYNRMTRAIVIVLGVLISATTGLLPISLAAVLGAVAMVLTGCLRSEEVHRAIDWRTIIAIGGMLPLGTALETTGTAVHIAGIVVTVTDKLAEAGSGWGPWAACALLGLTTVILTQIMTNAAAAIIIAPIGIGVAEGMAVNPHPIVMIVAIAASTAFVTPIGHQSNMLVYNAGGYRFTDFVRIGLPLTLLILALSVVIVPLLWPF